MSALMASSVKSSLVRTLRTRLSRAAVRWPRCSFSRARARSVVTLAGRTHACKHRSLRRHAAYGLKALLRPCQRTAAQPTWVRPWGNMRASP